MKLTKITMALAFAAGTLGLGTAVSAQDHRPPTDQMRHDDGMRHDDMGHREMRRDMHMRHMERHDRHSWGHGRQHCRTVWRHHHRIRQCW